jgi:hypothetical protein
MESIRIIPDLEQQGFADSPYEVTPINGELIIGGLGNATAEGRPSVMLGIKVGEKEYLAKQTTLSLFLSAADALKAKYGDPRT